jgi:phosphoglycerate dehydrogenase-like enzyme
MTRTTPPVTVLVSHRPDPHAWDALRARFPGARIVQMAEDGSVPTDARDARVLYRAAMPKPALSRAVGQCPDLEWVHTSTAGWEWVLVPEVLERDLQVTRTATALAAPIAEFVLTTTLALLKRLPELLAAQRDARWIRPDIALLGGRTVGIVGTGGIGRATAALFRAFGARTIGTKRTPEPLPEFDEVWSPDRLDDLLAASDVLVLACPLTAETRHLIDAAALRKLPRHALLINIARGAVVVEADLIAALQDGTIAGAALDVFDAEPLPADHPYWGLPNAIITPHAAFIAPDNAERAAEEFAANLGRYLRGEPLENLYGGVERGY